MLFFSDYGSVNNFSVDSVNKFGCWDMAKTVLYSFYD